MGFMEAVKHVFKNYATFSGRARRSEYWYFTLFNVLVITVLSILSSVIGVASYSRSSGAAAAGSLIGSGLMMVYSLATMIPGLAVTCRRLHDVGKAGTYILFALIPFVGSILLLVWECQDSMPGPNQYGPNPKGVNAAGWGGNPAMGGPVGGPAPVRQVPAAGAVPVRQASQITPPTQIPQTTLLNQAPPRQTPQGTAQFTLQGTAGEYAGKRIGLSGSVVLGREAECDIRFVANAPGVSRHHCQLVADGGRPYIRDLSSPCGTFVNGSRLPANQMVPLNSGDRIAIGSAEQSFTFVQ